MTESKAQFQFNEEEENFHQEEREFVVPQTKPRTSLSFHLNNDIIDSEFVKEIAMPCFSLNSPGHVEERSPILLTMYFNQKACTQVLSAAKNGFDFFKIEFKDANLNIQSTWNLKNAAIKAVNFGIVSKEEDESVEEFKCEINYQLLEINGVKL